ncbi:recombinase family protein [Anaerorhabdus sp.]|uniref:recombinase family protein n=1 Tax=Anaerorhabdus sp. TaxID=1872524 RepID=UPI002FC7989D
MPTVIKKDATIEVKPTIRVIPARESFLPNSLKVNKKQRVACYCRVSTLSDEQELSFDSQCRFYKDLINKNPEYILVDIYADEGISGTSVKKRKDFQRLMKDAMAGKIDLIITKSVTRFARNTLDAISWIRKLKDKGVDVFFETDNMHSLTANEMDLTILSAFAQESSHNKSIAIKWGYKRQFEKGKVYISNMYGYRSVNKQVVIVEKEAHVFREIVTLYLSGTSVPDIQEYLNSNKIKTRFGRGEWSVSGITRMLGNEKYCGDAILGKTYSKDFLNPKRIPNTGQKEKYYVENSHEGIISRDVFKAIQIETARRQGKNLINTVEIEPKKTGKKAQKKSCGKFTTVNALSNHIICAECGSFYRRAVWTRKNGGKVAVWRCSNKLDNGYNACPKSITIKEDNLFSKLGHIIRKKLNGKRSLHGELSKKVAEFVNPKDIISRKESIKLEIEDINQKIKEMIENDAILISRGVQDESQIKEHLEQHNDMKRKLNQELQELDGKLMLVRLGKEKKILDILNQLNVSNACFTQEELAVFIDNMVIDANYAEVVTTVGTVHKIDIAKL